jgi:hypothetical protein
VSDEDEELTEFEELQLATSPELRMLRLLAKLERRVASGEQRAEQRAEFILEQHAQLTSTVAALADAQLRTDERLARTEGSIRDLLAIVQLQADEVRDLTTAVRVVDEHQRAAGERARHTDARLNILINMVERYLDRRNGQE